MRSRPSARSPPGNIREKRRDTVGSDGDLFRRRPLSHRQALLLLPTLSSFLYKFAVIVIFGSVREEGCTHLSTHDFLRSRTDAAFLDSPGFREKSATLFFCFFLMFHPTFLLSLSLSSMSRWKLFCALLLPAARAPPPCHSANIIVVSSSLVAALFVAGNSGSRWRPLVCVSAPRNIFAVYTVECRRASCGAYGSVGAAAASGTSSSRQTQLPVRVRTRKRRLEIVSPVSLVACALLCYTPSRKEKASAAGRGERRKSRSEGLPASTSEEWFLGRCSRGIACA